jgi:cytolysin-activating lysine-acyltransferase
MIDMSATLKFSRDGLLGKLPPQKLNELIGEVTSLMMASKLHRKFHVSDIADLMLPAINLNQYRIYRNKSGAPVALVTWALFSPEVEQLYIEGKAKLTEAERTSGDLLYFIDFIAPYGHMKQVSKDLRTNVFPNQMGKSLRFMDIGQRREKPYQFYGVNYLKPLN